MIRGKVNAADDKTLEVEADDQRVITLQLTDKTTKPDHLTAGDEVEVDAVQDDKGVYTATNVKRTKAAPRPATAASAASSRGSTAASQAAAADPVDDRPTTTMATPVELEADDGRPPELKHGKPKQYETPPEPPRTAPVTTASARPPATAAGTSAPEPPASVEPPAPVNNAHTAFIDKAREAANNFLEGLPNYVCEQMTTRYASTGHVTDWQPIDVVTANLVYENHQERYLNLKINGKAVKKSIEETGAWSTGEFGTVLDDLFSPATAAHFRFIGERNIAGKRAALYDFDVDHPHSHWTVHVTGQYIRPAYKGTVWIENDNARALRIEMQAIDVPKEFPYDKTEMALDYDYTNLGVNKFLLPVKAEILMCERDSSNCERNTIEFRNYHKYEGESTITFH